MTEMSLRLPLQRKWRSLYQCILLRPWVQDIRRLLVGLRRELLC